MLFITTASGSEYCRQLDTDETALFEQMRDIDDPVIEEAEVRNGSGRVIGTEYTIPDEEWDFLMDSINCTQATEHQSGTSHR